MSGVQSGSFDDAFGWDPRDFRHALRRIRPDSFSEGIKPESPLLDKRTIVELLLDDHIEPAQSQRPVAPRPDLEPEIRALGFFGANGIHDNEFRSSILTGQDRLPYRGLRGRRTTPPDDDTSRRSRDRGRDIGGAEAVRETLSLQGGASARNAHPAGIRAPEEVEEPETNAAFRTMKGAMGQSHRFRTIAITQMLELRRDLIHGLVPRDALPPPFSATSHSLQGEIKPPGMSMVLVRALPLDADEPSTEGMLRIARQADDPIAFDVSQQATCHRTVATNHTLQRASTHHSSPKLVIEHPKIEDL
ncbi:hypothetical protein HRbin10_01942 [bacterium HR10]|nr:hypothetical protein HRbin10_01942 [bacterium HR10]